MNIAFVGNFVPKKGSCEFANLVKNFSNNDQFFIFGFVVDQDNFKSIKNKITLVRPFQEGELGTLLKKYQIDLVITPSIWPETFSITYFNSLLTSVPVLSRPHGFPYFLLQKHEQLFYQNIKDLKQKIDYWRTLNKQSRADFCQKIIPSDLKEKQGLKYQLVNEVISLSNQTKNIV